MTGRRETGQSPYTRRSVTLHTENEESERTTMGQSTNGKNPNSKSTPRNGSGSARLAERRAKRGRGADIADWGSVDANGLVSAVEAVTKAGGAIQFSYTKDGGAYAISIYIEGERDVEYVRPTENIDNYLSELATDFAATRDGDH